MVKAAPKRFGAKDLDRFLADLGADGRVARRLDAEADSRLARTASLSVLTADLAVSYLERLGRPIPSLTPAIGSQVVGRTYLAHMAVEADPAAFGAPDVPVLGTLPELRKGRPPQDLLSRVVKASRRSFEPLCALSAAAWDGFVGCLTRRSHDLAGPSGDFVPVDVIDGLARFGWVLRQVDIHYGLEPELAG